MAVLTETYQFLDWRSPVPVVLEVLVKKKSVESRQDFLALLNSSSASEDVDPISTIWHHTVEWVVLSHLPEKAAGHRGIVVAWVESEWLLQESLGAPLPTGQHFFVSVVDTPVVLLPVPRVAVTGPMIISSWFEAMSGIPHVLLGSLNWVSSPGPSLRGLRSQSPRTA